MVTASLFTASTGPRVGNSRLHQNSPFTILTELIGKTQSKWWEKAKGKRVYWMSPKPLLVSECERERETLTKWILWKGKLEQGMILIPANSNDQFHFPWSNCEQSFDATHILSTVFKIFFFFCQVRSIPAFVSDVVASTCQHKRFEPARKWEWTTSR